MSIFTMKTHALWLFVVSFVIWLRYNSTGALTTLTNLTYVPQMLTWNDARDACHHMGSHLVEIQGETKQNIVFHMLEKLQSSTNTTDIMSDTPLYIGLATLTLDSTDFYWTESCKPVTRQTGKQTKFSDAQLDMKCATLIISKRVWVLSYCFEERHYMCESTSGQKCPYTEYKMVRLQPQHPVTSLEVSALELAECFRLCDNHASDVGVECWAFNYLRYKTVCELFLTTQPYLLASSTFHEKDDTVSLYIRECYTIVLGDSYKLPTVETNRSSEPQVNCTTTTTAATPELNVMRSSQATSLTNQTHGSGDLQMMSSVTTSTVTASNHLTSKQAPSLTSQTLGSEVTQLMTSTTRSATTATQATSLTQPITTTTGATTKRHHGLMVFKNVTSLTSQSHGSEVSQLMSTTTEDTTTRNSSPLTPEQAVSPTTQSRGPVAQLISTTTGTTSTRNSSPLTPKQVTSLTSQTLGLRVSQTMTPTRVFRRSTAKPQDTSTNDEFYQKKNESCSCSCYKMASLQEKTQFLGDMLRNLTINKTQMSSFRRKYHSIMEYTPLAMGIGSTGVACLVLVLLLVIFCDVATFKHRPHDSNE